MAKQASDEPRAHVLKAKGMDDSQPTSPFQTWFRTNGMFADFGIMARMTGKALVRRYAGPVVAIHSDQQGNFWLQTSSELYIYDAKSFAAPTVATLQLTHGN